MAVGLNASGDYLRRTANLPASTSYTICGWAKITSVIGSAYQYFAGIEDATSSSTRYNLIGYDNTGTFQLGFDAGAGAANFSSNPTTNSWFFFALTCSGAGANNLKGYWAHSGTLNTVNGTGSNSFTAAMITLGNDSYSEYCNVHLAYVRVWGSVLTQTELETEMGSATPVKTSVLMDWRLPDSSTLTDSSGNGYSLTSGGTLTSETSPSFGNSVSVSDSITVTENKSAEVIININKSDSIAVTESVSVSIVTSALTINTSETVSVSESVAAAVGDPQVNKSESVTISESVSITLSSGATLSVVVSDTINIIESEFYGGSDPTISTSEAIAVSESVSALVGTSQVSKSDSIAVAESVALAVAVNSSASETMGISDTSGASILVQVSTNDTVSVSENVSLAIITAGTFAVSVSDSVLIIETTSAEVGSLQLSVSDSIATSENQITVEADLGVSVVENISVSELLVLSIVSSTIIYNKNNYVNVEFRDKRISIAYRDKRIES